MVDQQVEAVLQNGKDHRAARVVCVVTLAAMPSTYGNFGMPRKTSLA